jgi:hypothetical protein
LKPGACELWGNVYSPASAHQPSEMPRASSLPAGGGGGPIKPAAVAAPAPAAVFAVVVAVAAAAVAAAVVVAVVVVVVVVAAAAVGSEGMARTARVEADGLPPRPRRRLLSLLLLLLLLFVDLGGPSSRVATLRVIVVRQNTLQLATAGMLHVTNLTPRSECNPRGWYSFRHCCASKHGSTENSQCGVHVTNLVHPGVMQQPYLRRGGRVRRPPCETAPHPLLLRLRFLRSLRGDVLPAAGNAPRSLARAASPALPRRR